MNLLFIAKIFFKVGKITKQWSGFGREMFTDSDNFGVTFPIDLDVKVKSVLGNIYNFRIHFIADHIIEEDSLEKLFLVEIVDIFN